MKNLSFLKIWHRSFALHIEYIIEGIEETTFVPSVVEDATACQFGQWATAATEELKGNPKFKELLDVHAQFHLIAAQVLRMHVAGDYSAAKILSTDLISLSEAVAAVVDELEISLNLPLSGFEPNASRLKDADTATMWDDSLLVGIPIVDEQHKGIAKLADEFRASPTERLSSERGRMILGNLQSLVSLHFDTEELIMVRSELSEGEVSAHRADHDEILNSLVSLTYDLALSKVDMSFGEVYSLLEKAVISHVVIFDMSLSTANAKF